MPAYLSGPGLGLALPQNLYPTALQNAPIDASSNKLTLSPGQAMVLPAGDWYVSLGLYCVLQYLDPVNGQWVTASGGAWTRGMTHQSSDGFTVRIANLTGCPVSAAVTAPGNGSYTQASTTVTAVGGGGATWLPIVGGGLGTLTISSAGAGYGVAPILFIPPPPPASNNSNGVGGVQAHAYAIITSGTISSWSFTNPGAGYPSAPTVTVLPSPFDPNIATGITAATLTSTLVGSGSLMAVLCTNNGSPLANGSLSSYTLTVAGSGSGATATANFMQTVTIGSITGGGTGYGTVAAMMTTIGGVPAQGTFTNGQDYLYLGWSPRPAQIGLAVTALGTLSAQAGTIYDGGLFMGTPNAVVALGGLGSSLLAGATYALQMGSRPDVCMIQPAP